MCIPVPNSTKSQGLGLPEEKSRTQEQLNDKLTLQFVIICKALLLKFKFLIYKEILEAESQLEWVESQLLKLQTI